MEEQKTDLVERVRKTELQHIRNDVHTTFVGIMEQQLQFWSEPYEFYKEIVKYTFDQIKGKGGITPQQFQSSTELYITILRNYAHNKEGLNAEERQRYMMRAERLHQVLIYMRLDDFGKPDQTYNIGG